MTCLSRARAARWANLAVVNLRVFVGFAFVPAGLKKVTAQPFTDPANVGPFHEFLHAFHATGVFYQLVGVVQLTAAALIMTQRRATLGAALILPIIAAITAFCFSTGAGTPTRVVVTLLLAATVGLLLWELPRWRGLLVSSARAVELRVEPAAPIIDHRLWAWCGAAVLACYVAVCAITGEIYRPRGFEPGEPAFYVFPVMLAIVLAANVVDQARYRRK